MALSELTILRPTHGSFREYAEVAFGPMAGFVTGWLYWAGLVLALSSESTAAARFARLWLPRAPLWLLTLTIVVGVTLLNLIDVRLFSAIEGVMTAATLLAIAAMPLVPGQGAGLVAGMAILGSAAAYYWLARRAAAPA